MSAIVQEAYSYKLLAASAQVKASDGLLGGFFCTTAGTIKVWDSASAAGAVMIDTTAVVAGVFYPMPFAFINGCYITLAGGATGTAAFL